MPLQFLEFTDLPLQFIILEPYHCNFTTLRNMPLCTSSTCFLKFVDQTTLGLLLPLVPSLLPLSHGRSPPRARRAEHAGSGGQSALLSLLASSSYSRHWACSCSCPSGAARAWGPPPPCPTPRRPYQVPPGRRGRRWPLWYCRCRPARPWSPRIGRHPHGGRCCGCRPARPWWTA